MVRQQREERSGADCERETERRKKTQESTLRAPEAARGAAARVQRARARRAADAGAASGSARTNAKHVRDAHTSHTRAHASRAANSSQERACATQVRTRAAWRPTAGRARSCERGSALSGMGPECMAQRRHSRAQNGAPVRAAVAGGALARGLHVARHAGVQARRCSALAGKWAHRASQKQEAKSAARATHGSQRTVRGAVRLQCLDAAERAPAPSERQWRDEETDASARSACAQNCAACAAA